MARPFPKASGPILQANGLVARLVMRGGTRLLRMAVDRTLGKTAGKAAPEAIEKVAKAPLPAPVKAKGSITGKLAGAAAMKIATRSVPGAIIIGGGLLAKTLYDRRQAKKNA